MSRDARYRMKVAAAVAGLLTGIFGASWVIAGLIGEDWHRPEPQPRPTSDLPPWYGDLFGDGGDE